jgi:hypothetical protein
VERLNAFKSESLAAHAALLIRWDQQLSGANLSLEWNFISRPTARRLLPSVRSDSIYYFGKQPLTDSLAASSLCRLPFGRVMEVEVDCRLLLAEAASSLDAQQTNANNRSSPKVLRVDLERVAAGPWDLIAFHQSLLQYPDLRRVV